MVVQSKGNLLLDCPWESGGTILLEEPTWRMWASPVRQDLLICQIIGSHCMSQTSSMEPIFQLVLQGFMSSKAMR